MLGRPVIWCSYLEADVPDRNDMAVVISFLFCM